MTPGKGGSDVEGTPVFDTVRESVHATGANTSLIFVPARFACDAILEAYDAGIDVIVAITENIPAMDMARAVPYLAHGSRTVALIGPNCPGLISPGMANVGIIPGEICMRGPVGLVSRSGTLTYQIIHELTQRGIGQSTCVGIGGDPIPGSDFIDVLAWFETDSETELVVLVGEIGGDVEERAGGVGQGQHVQARRRVHRRLDRSTGKAHGSRGAIISGSKGTAAAKIDALKAAGIEVGANPTEVAEIVARAEGLKR